MPRKFMDTEQHRILRRRARTFLKMLGCIKFKSEYRVNIDHARKHYADRHYLIDEVGRTAKLDKIAVECRGVKLEKLQEVARLQIFDKIYVWPYGASAPYRWSEATTKICRQCGTDISNT